MNKEDCICEHDFDKCHGEYGCLVPHCLCVPMEIGVQQRKKNQLESIAQCEPAKQKELLFWQCQKSPDGIHHMIPRVLRASHGRVVESESLKTVNGISHFETIQLWCWLCYSTMDIKAAKMEFR